MTLQIEVNDNYQKQLLNILENLKGTMIESISKKDEIDDLGFLTSEIEKGLESGVSSTTHDELFKRLKTLN
jgi:hypothetical protein